MRVPSTTRSPLSNPVCSDLCSNPVVFLCARCLWSRPEATCQGEDVIDYFPFKIKSILRRFQSQMSWGGRGRGGYADRPADPAQIESLAEALYPPRKYHYYTPTQEKRGLPPISPEEGTRFKPIPAAHLCLQRKPPSDTLNLKQWATQSVDEGSGLIPSELFRDTYCFVLRTPQLRNPLDVPALATASANTALPSELRVFNCPANEHRGAIVGKAPHTIKASKVNKPPKPNRRGAAVTVDGKLVSSLGGPKTANRSTTKDDLRVRPKGEDKAGDDDFNMEVPKVKDGLKDAIGKKRERDGEDGDGSEVAEQEDEDSLSSVANVDSDDFDDDDGSGGSLEF